MNNISVYRYPGSYAELHNELPLYRESKKANIACRNAIEQAIKSHTNWKSVAGCSSVYIADFDPNKALDEVLNQFTIERVVWVVANTIYQKNDDSRIGFDNKRWAATIPVPSDPHPLGDNANAQYIIDKAHPLFVNDFASKVRDRYYEWKKQEVC